MVRTRLFWWIATAVGLSGETQAEGSQGSAVKELQSVSWSRFETSLHSKIWSENLVYQFLIDPDWGGLVGAATSKQQIDMGQAQAIA